MSHGAEFFYTKTRKPEYVRLCFGCWNDGPNTENWDDRIQQRIHDRRAKKKPKTRVLRNYEFSGEATVSVTCRVEAYSPKEARAKVDAGECEWECDQVDGDVSRVEMTGRITP